MKKYYGLTRALSKAGLFVKKHAPEIYAIVGVCSIGYGTYRVAKDSRKMEPILEDAKLNIEAIHEEKETNPEYTTAGRDIARSYMHYGAEIVKVIGPGVGFVAGGTISLLTAVGKLKGRNAGLIAAYNGLKATHDAYRGRVREVVGDSKENDIYFGRQVKDFVSVESNEETGTITTEHQTGYLYEMDRLPGDTIPFDSQHSSFVHDGDPHQMTELLLSSVHKKLMEKKVKRGFIYRGDIYEALGITYVANHPAVRRNDFTVGQVYYEGVPLDQQPVFSVVGYDDRVRVSEIGELHYKVPIVQIPIDGDVLSMMFGGV